MGTTYGSNDFLKQELQQSSIGTITPNHGNKTSLTGLFRIFIVVMEIGLTLALPGIGTALGTAALAAGTVGNLIASTAIGLGSAGLNTALSSGTINVGNYSIGERNVSAAGIAIDFGSAFLPIGMGLNTARKITKSIASEEAIAAEEEFLKGISPRTANKVARAQRDAKIARAESLSKRADFKYSKLKSLRERFDPSLGGKGYNSKAYKAARDVMLFGKQGAYTSEEAAAKLILDAANKYKTTVKEIKEVFEDWRRIFQEVKAIPWVKRFTHGEFIAEVEKLAGKERAQIIKDIYLNKALYPKGRLSLERKTALEFIEKTLNKVGTKPEVVEYVKMYIGRLSRVPLAEKEIEKEVIYVISMIASLDKQAYMKLTKMKTFNKFAESFKIFSYTPDKFTWWRKFRVLGSAEFNNKWVQPIQAIFDPNDLGRTVPELAYRWAKKAWTKKLEGNAFKEGQLAVEKNLKRGSWKEASLWKKAGGDVMKTKNAAGRVVLSQYIFGIKKLPAGTPLFRLVLVSFNKNNTKTKTGKNAAGKRDIIVTMTDYDYDRLVLEGTDYWFAVGHKKGWFISRGGKSTERLSSSISNELSLFLGFMPIPALRNVLSIVSNVTENIAKMAKGEYLKHYTAALERAFVRSSINRTGRFITKNAIGQTFAKGIQEEAKVTQTLLEQEIEQGARITPQMSKMLEAANEKSLYGGRWLGRELQRSMTTTLSMFEGQTKSGYFTFKSGSTKTHSAAYNWGYKMAAVNTATIARSNLLRSNKFSYGRKMVGTKRNLGQMTRIYSAITPARTVKPLRNITAIK